MFIIYLKAFLFILMNIAIGVTVVTLTHSPALATVITGFFTAWTISIAKEETKQLKLKDLSA